MSKEELEAAYEEGAKHERAKLVKLLRDMRQEMNEYNATEKTRDIALAIVADAIEKDEY